MTTTFIIGPPCSGKSTYAAEHKPADAYLYDLDLIAHAITGHPMHSARSALTIALAEQLRDNAHRLASMGHPWWFVQTRPPAGSGRIILVTAPLDVLMARAADRPDPEATRRVIASWFTYYAGSFAPDLTIRTA